MILRTLRFIENPSKSRTVKPNVFRKTLFDWYAENKRELPWRGISDPYKIWVSEIILQQTRIEQGADYYRRFVETFPDVKRLALAEEDEVLKAWEGLGYYSRARHLHEAARKITQQGHFPDTYEKLLQLPGVGPYTAAAIASMAFGIAVATVDGNVYRVLSRTFGIATPIDTNTGKKEFAQLAQRLLSKERPSDFNQAMMDFGAIQCTPLNPQCETCPFRPECVAYKLEQIDKLPVKAKQTVQTHRYFYYFFVRNEEALLVHRRPSGDIWQGLYEPYLVETPTPEETLALNDPFIKYLMDKGAHLKAVKRNFKHILTHRIIHADFYELNWPPTAVLPQEITAMGYFFATPDQLTTLAFPRIIDEGNR